MSTTRSGGLSKNEYASFNLGGHVQDSLELVSQNRNLLLEELQLPSEPVWLNQVHGNNVLKLDDTTQSNIIADASYTDKTGIVCAILTADCLPVVFCDQKGEYIAAVHAGWRGLANGVLDNTLQALPVDNDELMCWLGPAIGPNMFEVGSEVVQQFTDKDKVHENAFNVKANNKYLADIYQLARNILLKHGVHQ
ncbi:MAG: peptidoglycan editing factor PgeF, partial [Pseudomonadota bacterium]